MGNEGKMVVVMMVVVLSVVVEVSVVVVGCCNVRHLASTSHKVDVLVWRSAVVGRSGGGSQRVTASPRSTSRQQIGHRTING